jgi:hypothetical protein
MGMKETDKQWSGDKDKDRNKAEREKMARERGKQQQAEEMGERRQAGDQGSMGRKERDHDPDGDRMGHSNDDRTR